MKKRGKTVRNEKGEMNKDGRVKRVIGIPMNSYMPVISMSLKKWTNF